MTKEEIIAGAKYCCSGKLDCGDCSFCDKKCTEIFC